MRLSDLLARRFVFSYLYRRRDQLLARYPQMCCYALDTIAMHLSLDGRYEREELEFILTRFDGAIRGRTVLDVGANIGNHTLAFAERAARVVALEPHPVTFRLLELNVREADNVTPLNLGASDRRANHAARSGHEVTIVSAYPIDAGLMLDGIDPGIRIRHVADRPSRFGKYARLAPWLVGNRQWLLDQDIIHCHLTFGAVAGTAIQVLRRALSRRRPVVVETFHAVGMPIPGWKRALSARLAAGRDGFALMAEDSYWAEFRRKHPRLPTRIISNGVAVGTSAPSDRDVGAYRKTVGVPDGARIVGTIGRIAEDRMPLRMIDVFAALDRLGLSDVHFLMGGDGPQLDAARAHASALGIGDRVHFPGLVTRPPLAYALIDLYVSINVGPITGVAGLEAAAAGTPVIALQARADYSAGGQDWIWSSADPAEVARRAAELLARPEEARRIAAEQSAHVRSALSIDAMAAAYERLYADCST